MRLSLITLLLLIGSNSFGQINNYQTLLDTALDGHRALFVHSKPLKITRLDTKDIRDYVENLRDWSHESLDTAMFSQIIQNSKLADTTLWTDKELPNSLLVSARDESISKKTAFQKLKLTDEKQVKFYKKQINKFNSTQTIDRELWYFSRPVFDDSKKFAIIQWDNGHSYLGGGGGIILYHLQGDTWEKVGIIMNWRY